MIEMNWPEGLIDDWIAKAKCTPKEFVIELIQELNDEVTMATPVKTGFLVNSWRGGINNIPEPDGGGQGGVGDLNAAAADFELGDTYYAVNTAAYAARIEYGFVGADSLGRVYNQAPRSYVRSTLARVQEIANSVAVRLGMES